MKKRKAIPTKPATTEPMRSVPIGRGIWMLLPADITPKEKEKRVSNYLQKANKELPVYNPNA